MAVTAENVQRAIFEYVGFDATGRYRPDWDGIHYSLKDGQAIVIGDGLYVVQTKDYSFGHEGDFNADTYIVFEVRGDDEPRYFQIAGYYQSYDGTTWESNLYQVEPEEVKVIKWRLV